MAGTGPDRYRANITGFSSCLNDLPRYYVTSDGVVNPAVRFVTVSADFAGQRLDNFLMRELKGVPKSKIYNILRRGEVAC